MNSNETNTPDTNETPETTPVKKRRKRFPPQNLRRAYIGTNEHVYEYYLPRLQHAFQRAIEKGNQLAVFIIRLPHNRSAEQKAVQYEFDCVVPVCSRFEIVEFDDATFNTLREVETWEQVLQAAEELAPTVRRGHKLGVYGLNAEGLTMQGNLLRWQWTEEATTGEPLTVAPEKTP